MKSFLLSSYFAFYLILNIANIDCLSLDTQARIVGKSLSASNEQFYWHVRLSKYGGWINGQWVKEGVCNGGLISRQWVLTSASCVINTFFVTIYLGFEKKPKSDETYEIRNSAGIVRHPFYNAFTHENDIALVKLGLYIGPSSFIIAQQAQNIVQSPPNAFNAANYEKNMPKKVKTPMQKGRYILPVAYIDKDEDFNGEFMTLSSYGSTNRSFFVVSSKLRNAFFDVITNDECRELYKVGPIFDTQLCAKAAKRTDSIGCLGDEGAPGTIVSDRKNAIIAIYSFSGMGCNEPSIFTRVSKYIDWIKQITNVEPGKLWTENSD